MAEHNFQESMEKFKIIKDDTVSSVARLRALRGENLEDTKKQLQIQANQILKAKMMDGHPELDPENNQYSESTQRMSAVLRTRDKYDVEAYTTEIREQVGDGLQNVQSSRQEREAQDKNLIYYGFIPKDKVQSAHSHMPWLRKQV